MSLNYRNPGTAIWVLALALLVPASAQVTGSLSGTVEDPNKMAVVNVRVVLTLHDSDVEEAATTTTGTGAFFFPALRPIYYDLKVEAPNFKTQTLTNVKIDPTSETSLAPIQLELGANNQTVTVVAPPQPLQTANAEVSNTLTQDQVSELPLFARDPLAQLGLLDTLPGVNTNGRDAGVRTIDGQTVSYANITYDGVNIQDNGIRFQGLNSTILDLHTEQISEATIVTSNPSTIYSGGSSQVAFSTPSGTNAFHGSLYWLNIPGNINAQTFFSNLAPANPVSTQLNQAGATVGGPIVKDKLFFFANFEADLDGSRLTNVVPVPTAALTSSNPTVQQILNIVPSNPSGLASISQRNGDTTYLGLARLDYKLSAKNAFSFSTDINESAQALPSLSEPYTRQPNTILQTDATFFAGSWRWAPTASFTNELRLGTSLPRLDFVDSLRNKYPFILNTGLSQFGIPEPMEGIDPQGRSDRVYNYQDSATYVRGSHSIQFGFSLQQYREWEYGINAGTLSSVTFPTYDLFTFDKSGNFVSGIPNGTVFAENQPFGLYSPSAGYRGYTPPVTRPSANWASGYLQDNWKALKRLSLNLGMRYEYLSAGKDDSGLAILPALSGAPAASAVYNPNLQFAFVGKDQGLYHADKNNFAPYFGFAWQVGDRLPIVIRGAYSISYVNDDLLRNLGTYAELNGFQSPVFSNQNLGNGTLLPLVPPIPTPSVPALNLPALETFYGGSTPRIEAVDPKLRTPYVQQANLTVQTSWKGLLWSVGYVGNRLVKGLVATDRNQVGLSSQYLADFPQLYTKYEPTLASFGLFALPNEAGQFAQNLQLAGFPPGIYNFFANPNAPNGIFLLSNLGRSRYDSLRVDVSRRFSSGFAFTADYAYSNNLSNVNDYAQGATDPYLDINNPSLEKATSPFQLRHAFKSTAIYDFPFKDTGSGLMHKVLGGWGVSGIMIAQSGAPFSLLSELGTFNTEANSGENTLSTSLTAGQIEQYLGVQRSPSGLVTFVNAPAGSFQEPGPGQVGNLGRRIFTGPNAFNLDLSVRKIITITERMRVEVRAESINVLNNENWLVNDQFLQLSSTGTPLVSNGNAVFGGGLSQWTPPRSFQFMLRVRF